MRYIDPELCIDCEACVSECPVEAIYPDHAVPAEWQHYVDLNAQMSQRTPPIVVKKTPLVDQMGQRPSDD